MVILENPVIREIGSAKINRVQNVLEWNFIELIQFYWKSIF